MRRIDELHLLYLFAGSRMLRDRLRHVQTLAIDVGQDIKGEQVLAAVTRIALVGAWRQDYDESVLSG